MVLVIALVIVVSVSIAFIVYSTKVWSRVYYTEVHGKIAEIRIYLLVAVVRPNLKSQGTCSVRRRRHWANTKQTEPVSSTFRIFIIVRQLRSRLRPLFRQYQRFKVVSIWWITLCGNGYLCAKFVRNFPSKKVIIMRYIEPCGEENA